MTKKIIKESYVKKILILLIIITTGIYFFINSIIGNERFSNLKQFLNFEQKQLIKKYIFPIRNKISQQKQKILQLNKQEKKILAIFDQESFNWSIVELIKKHEGGKISTKKSVVKLSNNKDLKKFQLNSGFYAGIRNKFPGSGYIDFYKRHIIVMSARGILVFKKDIQNVKEDFTQIKNNINDYIDIQQFEKNNNFSLKDLFIYKNKIFVSFTEEIKENCWNTSLLIGDMNFKDVIFKKLFSPEECVHSVNNVDKDFRALQAGGRIVSFDDNHILLSTGEFRERFLAQETKSINGKILKININDDNYEIISMGHRNPQGLFFDKEDNFILETEHGPQGGDEINLIEIDKLDKDKIQNYGWAISSDGEHYPGGKSDEELKETYEKYPLYKSHTEYGFIKPLKSFVPSIAISEIVKISEKKYVVASMKDKSLYFFEINEKRQVLDLKRVEVYERIRDLRFHGENNQLYLFMEDTASIGLINLN